MAIPESEQKAARFWKGDVVQIYRVTRTLTSEEILSLHTSPTTIIPAQEGRVIIPLFGFSMYHLGESSYETAEEIYIGFPDGSGYLINAPSGAITSPNNHFTVFYALTNTDGDVSYFEGRDLKVFTGTSDPTGGDGTLDITVIYTFIDVS